MMYRAWMMPGMSGTRC
jgi:hypothetical protein